MITIKTKEKNYQVGWNHVKRPDLGLPTTTYCFLKDTKGLIASAEVTCQKNCTSKDKLRKEALKEVICKVIPRTELETRKSFWDAYANMTPQRRWQKKQGQVPKETIYYTVPEVAKRLRVSTNSIYSKIKKGIIDIHGEEGHIKIAATDLELLSSSIAKHKRKGRVSRDNATKGLSRGRPTRRSLVPRSEDLITLTEAEAQWGVSYNTLYKRAQKRGLTSTLKAGKKAFLVSELK